MSLTWPPQLFPPPSPVRLLPERNGCRRIDFDFRRNAPGEAYLVEDDEEVVQLAVEVAADGDLLADGGAALVQVGQPL